MRMSLNRTVYYCKQVMPEFLSHEKLGVASRQNQPI